MPRILTALLVLTAFAACSQDVKLVRMNEGLAEAAAPYQRPLVIAVAASEAQRLSLEDETTGRRVELNAFGPTNAGAFARLLREGPAGRELALVD